MIKTIRRLLHKRVTSVDVLPLHPCEIQSCLKHTFIIFRWIGFFPVEGLTSSNIEEVRFQLKSVYSLYYILSMVGQITSLGLSVYKCLFDVKFSTGTLINMILYLGTTINAIILTNIARHWPKVVKEVSKLEFNLKDIRKPKNTRRICDIISYTIFAMLIVERIISFLFFTKILKICLKIDDGTDQKWNIILKKLVPKLFSLTPYAHWKFIIYKFVELQTTVLDGLINSIVLCLTVYLIAYFRDLHRTISTHKTKSPRFWERKRCQYTHLDNLVRIINGQLKYLIMCYFLVYLLYICVQLFFVINSYSYKFQRCDENLLNKLRYSTEQNLYFITSTLLPILRFLITWFLAANLHIEAKKPLLYLHEVLDSNYNLDIQRFRLQILYCPISLSGSLFCVTRNTILKVVSKIITYELVLLQLNKSRRLHID